VKKGSVSTVNVKTRSFAKQKTKKKNEKNVEREANPDSLLQELETRIRSEGNVDNVEDDVNDTEVATQLKHFQFNFNE
jgi:hypothetical protein